MLWGDLPERGKKQVNVGDLLDLINEECDIGQELLWRMIIQYVHVDPLSPAVGESFLIVLLLNECSNTCNNHCSRIDCLKIASGHLKHKTGGCRHGCNKSCSTLDTSASLILFWVIWRNFKIYLKSTLNTFQGRDLAYPQLR